MLEVCPQSHSFDVIAFGILIVLNYNMFNKTWNFQMKLLLDGNGIFGFLDGSIPCPDKSEFDSDAYTVWKIHDKALMTLITATFATAALSCVIGCKSSKEM